VLRLLGRQFRYDSVGVGRQFSSTIYVSCNSCSVSLGSGGVFPLPTASSQALIPIATLLSVVWLKEHIGWRRSLAIAGALVGVVIMIYEPGALSFDPHAEIWRVDKRALLIAAAYSAVAVSVIAHGQYFRLLQNYPVDRVVPLSILVTVFATVFGILILKETLYLRYIIGAALILPCVWIIARRGTPAPAEMD